MFKLPIIGAVLMAAASASTFKNKFAMKPLSHAASISNSNSTATPPTPQEIYEAYRDAYLESDVPNQMKSWSPMAMPPRRGLCICRSLFLRRQMPRCLTL